MLRMNTFYGVHYVYMLSYTAYMDHGIYIYIQCIMYISMYITMYNVHNKQHSTHFQK